MYPDIYLTQKRYTVMIPSYHNKKKEKTCGRDQKWKPLSRLYWYHWANRYNGPAPAHIHCWIRQIINHFAFATFIIFCERKCHIHIHMREHTHNMNDWWTKDTQCTNENMATSPASAATTTWREKKLEIKVLITHYSIYAFHWIFLLSPIIWMINLKWEARTFH